MPDNRSCFIGAIADSTVKKLAGSVRSLVMKRILLSLPLVAFIVWLAYSSSPSGRRERQINALIKQGELGRVDPALAKRLQMQFPWLARHAGATHPVAINAPIDRRRLTLIVTTPPYEKLTHCGSGNALFDPDLNAIFIDQSLLWPTEVNIIGSPSVNTMFTINDYGYIVSYTNFILAHELGHWQKHRRAAAFFYYGWGEGSASLSEELEADQSAVATIFAAHSAGDEPSELKKLDALAQVGIKSSQSTDRDAAAGDILGGIILMANDLLFSSSPFSPYYSNPNHPNMLARADIAIRNVEVSPPGETLRAETDVVQAELARFSALGDWQHKELFLPGPLTRVDVGAGFLWLGRTDIPAIDTERLQEQIEKIPLKELVSEREDSTKPISAVEVKTGYSKVGEKYNYAESFGTWVDQEFENGDPQIGLPPATSSLDPMPDPGWQDVEHSRFSLPLKNDACAEPSNRYMVWQWPSHNTAPPGKVTERFLADSLKRLLSGKALSMGRLQWRGDALVFGVVAQAEGGKTEFHVFEVSTSAPSRITELTEFHLSSFGDIDLSGATVWGGDFWVPVRIGEGKAGYHAELWKITAGSARMFDTVPFLAGQAEHSLDFSNVNRMAPMEPRLQPLSGGRAVFGYTHDSFYLVDERLGHLKLLFHPASAGLQVTDLGSGSILIWNLHARKAYTIRIDHGEK